MFAARSSAFAETRPLAGCGDSGEWLITGVKAVASLRNRLAAAYGVDVGMACYAGMRKRRADIDLKI